MSEVYLNPQLIGGVPEVSCEEVKQTLGKVRLIDVRRPDEFNNELGHIQGAELVTLGPELEDFLAKAPKDQEIVFVCRSGARSANATMYAQSLGFKHVINMTGGMIRWNDVGLKAERE